MQRNDPKRAAVANPHRRRWPVMQGPAKTKARRRPYPAVSRREYPAAIVIRQPAPRRRTDKCIAEERILIPPAIAERRPAEAHPERPPAVAIPGHRIPRAVGVEIPKARRIVRRIHILRGIVRCSRHTVNAAGYPAVEIVGI